MDRVRLLVVGGGLAGLAAAWRGVQLGLDVTVLEADERLGGQIYTERVDGCVLEHGAEGFVARSEAVPALCRSVGLGEALRSQATHRALVLRGGALEELPEGAAGRLLGIQASNADWGHGLCTLQRGMGSLVEGLEQALPGGTVERRRAVTDLGPGVAVQVDGGTRVEADAIVLAVPGAVLARLSAERLPEVARRCAEFRTVSSVSIALVYRREAVGHALDASGFICADGPGPGLRACTFVSAKFADRAPDGWCILRAFYRPGPEMNDWDDDAWRDRCLVDLTPVLDLAGPPEIARVTRWPQAIPRYTADHDTQMEAIRQGVRSLGPIELAGAAVVRSGVDGAVRSGADSVARLGLGQTA